MGSLLCQGRRRACGECQSAGKDGLQLRTTAGKAIYRRRKCTIEPVFGQIKEGMGFRQLSLRDLSAAAGEWCLVCLAYNLRRLHVLMGA